MNFWLLCFRGWTRIGLSDGALAVMARHLPQLRVLP